MESANHGSQVLHVRDDSDSQMEQLFDVLKQRLPQPGQTPFRDRNLPKSFFEQPSRLSHSRESSQDSTTNLGVGLVGRSGPVGHPGIAIHHGRSQSSPAQLPVTLSAAPPPPQPQHNKQNSMDFVEGMGQLHIPPGPANWEPIKTGQPRCFNVAQEQTSWPKSVSTNTLNTVNVQGSHTPQGTLSPAQSHPSSPSVSVQNLGPLPRGWEQGVTPDGEIYYINHIEKTTSWFDPRIPKHLQRPGPVKLGQPQAAPQSVASQLQSIQAQQQGTLSVATNLQTQTTTMSQAQQVSPPQPAQQSAPQSTTQQSRPPQPRTQQPPTSSSSQNPQLIQFELERLKQEKDRLHREQAEIMKRELLLKEMMSKPTPQLETMPPTSIQSVSTSGIDPFLGQGSTNMEAHARQNSGDSGLGGMGTSYSLPRTPEDFLSNVDEMDTESAGIKQLLKPQGSDFNMNDLQNNVCMEMGSLGDPDQSGMESDDLVPSLQEDISNLGTDLLNDVDVAKMENLLWL